MQRISSPGSFSAAECPLLCISRYKMDNPGNQVVGVWACEAPACVYIELEEQNDEEEAEACTMDHIDHCYSSDNTDACLVTIELKNKIRNLQRIANNQKYRIQKMKQYIKELKMQNKETCKKQVAGWLDLYTIDGSTGEKTCKRTLLIPRNLQGRHISLPDSCTEAEGPSATEPAVPRLLRSRTKKLLTEPERAESAGCSESDHEKEQEGSGTASPESTSQQSLAVSSEQQRIG
ncbi:uncharacterized protein LOC101731254 isoform X1 [Xenopus tropicalis]|uniref:Uncharacterized protein LOC101731254 isoform X1 n=2 Tax=Xenopus tropicalis TaxID=8364 RepID=A0A8J0SXF5_XENTR|nr:uncharacterized protein LOC101731254 isoform X1 [Xenopus tropicalis]